MHVVLNRLGVCKAEFLLLNRDAATRLGIMVTILLSHTKGAFAPALDDAAEFWSHLHAQFKPPFLSLHCLSNLTNALSPAVYTASISAHSLSVFIG